MDLIKVPVAGGFIEREPYSEFIPFGRAYQHYPAKGAGYGIDGQEYSKRLWKWTHLLAPADDETNEMILVSPYCWVNVDSAKALKLAR